MDVEQLKELLSYTRYANNELLHLNNEHHSNEAQVNVVDTTHKIQPIVEQINVFDTTHENVYSPPYKFE